MPQPCNYCKHSWDCFLHGPPFEVRSGEGVISYNLLRFMEPCGIAELSTSPAIPYFKTRPNWTGIWPDLRSIEEEGEEGGM